MPTVRRTRLFAVAVSLGTMAVATAAPIQPLPMQGVIRGTGPIAIGAHSLRYASSVPYQPVGL